VFIPNMAEFDRLAYVERLAEPVKDCLEYDESLAISHIRELKCAIVFLHAFWSGPSVHQLRHLARALATIDPNQLIRLVVCDTDKAPHLAAEPYGMGVTSGGGEMMWVCNGIVRARHGSHSGQRDIKVTTESLLSECQDSCP
jgi:hypothetical protein